jgi:hypothetical protein
LASEELDGGGDDDDDCCDGGPDWEEEEEEEEEDGRDIVQLCLHIPVGGEFLGSFPPQQTVSFRQSESV